MTRHRLRPNVLTSALALTTLIAAPVSARSPEEADDFATIESRAYAQEEAGEHREAALLWTELARRDDASPRARQQAAYEAQGAYRLAYEGSRDPALLCAGWSLVDG